MTEKPTWIETLRDGAAWLKARRADYAQAATALQPQPAGSRLIQQPGLVSEADGAREAEVP